MTYASRIRGFDFSITKPEQLREEGNAMKAAAKRVKYETIAELLKQLGGIHPKRVRANPLPGTATEKDLIALNERTNRLYELVNGILVEKVMSFPESVLACELIAALKIYLRQNNLGIVAGESGAMRLLPDLIRIPDVSFVSWESFPDRKLPLEAVAGVAPDLAVEVLSKGNTKKEMERKLREYFFAGVRLVWLVDKDKRTVEVFSAPDQSVLLREGQTLDGGDVLPGFSLPLKQLFAELPSSGSTAKKPSGRRKRG